MKNKNTLILFIFFAAISVISACTAFIADETVISYISTASTLIGIFGLIFSLYLDRNITEATFLFDMHKTFRENTYIKRISIKLEKSFIGEDTVITEADRTDIVEYLTFFEIVASMEQRGIVSINSFDPLFGYDFFIAVNNKDIQRIELEPFSAYYSSTLKLLKKWKKYRNRHKLPIPYDTDNRTLQTNK